MAQAEASLIDEGSTSHHFGSVISRTGRTLDHSYSLRNNTARDVTILKVINRKTCCGTVHVGKALLHPGDQTDIKVSLMVGDKFGSVIHETEVVTEPPPSQELVFRTSAVVYPALRVEYDSSIPTVLLGASEPRRVEFRVIAYGSASEPPIDLDRLVLRSTLEGGWVGPTEDVPDEDGLKVESRQAIVSLKKDGLPGDRRASVEVLDGDHSLF